MTTRTLEFPAQRPERASAPESAKALKAALHAAFPAVTFSVRLDRGTAYGCASVSWEDGPTTRRVEAIVDRFSGEGFDGMTDSTLHYNATLPDGRRSGLRLISCQRHVSATLARKAAAQVASYFGIEPPTITQQEGSRYWQIEGGDSRYVRADIPEYWSTLIHRCASDRTQYSREER